MMSSTTLVISEKSPHPVICAPIHAPTVFSTVYKSATGDGQKGVGKGDIGTQVQIDLVGSKKPSAEHIFRSMVLV